MNRWIEIFFFIIGTSLFHFRFEFENEKEEIFDFFIEVSFFFFEEIKFENVRSGHANLSNSE